MPQFKTTHGFSRHPMYKAWTTMIQRCTNPKASEYDRYGGVGIVVCDTWRNSFSEFLKDMGVRPQGTSLDRIDGSKGYCKSNCRWATVSEQLSNRRGYSKNSRNTTGIVGVYWKESHKKFVARATINGSRRYLGFYATIEEAQKAVEAHKKLRDKSDAV